jgi:anti-sigma factor RsiW
MMIDDKLREQLVAYLDDELTPGEASDVERRAREDPDVAREIETLRETDALLDLYPGPTRQVDLASRVVERARRRGRVRRIRAALALAASILILAGIWIVVRGGGETSPTPEPGESAAEMAIENLHALEYMALLEQTDQSDALAFALLESADLILVLDEEEVEVR